MEMLNDEDGDGNLNIHVEKLVNRIHIFCVFNKTTSNFYI